jgi:L-ascorbate metabolism protein UlaG (beta-lactamase superfamily)
MTTECRRLVLILLALFLSFSLLACAINAFRPKAGAPEHHLEVGFRNPNPNYAPSQGSFWRSFWMRRTFENLFSPDPIVDLPRVENDGRFLRENGSEATVTWVGHSTLLIQLEGINILTDPQWSQRASPVSFAGPKRFTEPGLRFEDLPRIDLVVISHDHYDHLDVSTVTRLAKVHRPTFFVPLGLKEWFADLDITDIIELDWWESRKFKNLVVTCVPAQHFSGRTPWTRNRTLWSGWVVAGQAKRFYFAGDTAYYEGLKEIGRRLGPFDLTAIPIGPYVPGDFMRSHHTNPEEAIQLFLDVKGERFVPIHWGTFYTPQVGDEPIRRVEAEARRLEIAPKQLLLLKHGESRPW